MGKLMGLPDTEVHKTLSNFAFSGVKVDELKGDKYCICNLLIDESSSIEDFRVDLENAANMVVASIKKSPMVERVMLRTAVFSSSYVDRISELHGFMSVRNIPDDKFTGTIKPAGCTPLIDAALNALESIETYGKQMQDMEIPCNGIFYVMTDGAENASRTSSAKKIKEGLERIRKDEQLESIIAILIGVNDTQCKDELAKFASDAGFEKYISIGDATAGKLAKLAEFISKSVSSQSQAIGSGGPSQAINYSL